MVFRKKLLVRFLQGVASLHGQSYSPGDELELPEPEAQVWADGVRAEAVGWTNTHVNEEKADD